MKISSLTSIQLLSQFDTSLKKLTLPMNVQLNKYNIFDMKF